MLTRGGQRGAGMWLGAGLLLVALGAAAVGVLMSLYDLVMADRGRWPCVLSLLANGAACAVSWWLC